MNRQTADGKESQAERTWEFLPARLRGRGDFLVRRGRVKDAELMYDAASEIEALRKNPA